MKRVRITLELEMPFLSLLNAEIGLDIQPKIKEGAELTPSRLLAWLIFNEARGTYPEQLAASVPIMNRERCPELIEAERRVYDGDQQLSGPVLIAEEIAPPLDRAEVSNGSGHIAGVDA